MELEEEDDPMDLTGSEDEEEEPRGLMGLGDDEDDEEERSLADTDDEEEPAEMLGLDDEDDEEEERKKKAHKSSASEFQACVWQQASGPNAALA